MMRLLRWAFLVPLSATLLSGSQAGTRAGQAVCVPVDPVRQGWTRTFEENFADFNAHRPGRWETSFVWGGRTIPDNKELQIYVDPAYRGATNRPLGLNPFLVEDGRLVIAASRLNAKLSGKAEGFSYMSGLLTTAGSFQQTYGYFEIRAKLPAGKGLWPAFWLLPPNGKWPPEIDVFEVLGQEPHRVHLSVHSADKGEYWSTSKPVTVKDTSAGFHDYGLLWTADRLTWFFDGCPMAETPTPADLHGPMYMLINLAVGGWAGSPNHSTQFPAKLSIERVAAFSVP